ncbi:MAG: hypothetical protein Fur0018_23960 [Anaerolineales bacterium]
MKVTQRPAPQTTDTILQGYVFIFLTLFTLYPALLAGAYVGYSVMFAPQGQPMPPWDALISQGIVITIGFLTGTGILAYGIDKLHITAMSWLARMAAVSAVAAMLIFHIKMVAKLVEQNYTLEKFVMHTVSFVILALIVLILDNLHPVPMRKLYTVPLILGNLAHFNAMLVRYVFVGSQYHWRILEDFIVFNLVLVIVLAFSGHLTQTINLLAYKLTKTIVEV